MINISMDKKQETSYSEAMINAHNHKRTFAQACKECNAIPLSQFEKEFWEAFYEGYRKRRKR